MRVLLTRAAVNAARSRHTLLQLGHEVIVSPLTEIVGTGAAWPGGEIGGLVATSAQAFTWPPDLGARRYDLPLLLVGRRTRDAARATGFDGPILCAPDVATLLLEMKTKPVVPCRLVYWAARDRRPDLAIGLAALGFYLETVEAYAAMAADGLGPTAAGALASGQIDAVLHYSRRSAALFRDAATAAAVDITGLSHLCLSKDSAVPLQQAGCRCVEIAKAPNEAALFSLLGG